MMRLETFIAMLRGGCVGLFVAMMNPYPPGVTRYVVDVVAAALLVMITARKP